MTLIFIHLICCLAFSNTFNADYANKCQKVRGTYNGNGAGCLCPNGIYINPYIQKCDDVLDTNSKEKYSSDKVQMIGNKTLQEISMLISTKWSNFNVEILGSVDKAPKLEQQQKNIFPKNIVM